jgi:hypothetical protein
MRRPIWISLHQNATIDLDFASSQCDDRFEFRCIKMRRSIWISLHQNATIDLDFATPQFDDRFGFRFIKTRRSIWISLHQILTIESIRARYRSSISARYRSSISARYRSSISARYRSSISARYRSSITIIRIKMALTCPCTRLPRNNCGDITFGIDVLKLNACLESLAPLIRHAGSATLLASLARRRVPTIQRL